MAKKDYRRFKLHDDIKMNGASNQKRNHLERVVDDMGRIIKILRKEIQRLDRLILKTEKTEEE